MACTLKFWRGNARNAACSRCKGNERRRDIELLKAARHRVLATNGGKSQVGLRHKCAEECSGGLTPALGDIAQALKVLLEGEIGIPVANTSSYELGDRFDNRDVGSVELVGAHEVGVKAPCHARNCSGLAVNGQLCNHRHRRRELRASAKGHKDGSCSYSGVEALGESLVRGNVEVAYNRVHALGQARSSPGGLPATLRANVDILVLRRTIGAQKLTAHIDDGLSAPLHGEARLSANRGYRGSFEVFLARVGEELINIFGRKRYGHALLRLRDSKLGAVEPLVLLGNEVEVYMQAIG